MTAVAGLAGSVQVAIMGRFGERVGVFEALAFSTLVTAVLSCAVLLAARQTVSGYADGLGAAIDRFGLFGVEQIPISWERAVGIALLAVGAALSLRK